MKFFKLVHNNFYFVHFKVSGRNICTNKHYNYYKNTKRNPYIVEITRVAFVYFFKQEVEKVEDNMNELRDVNKQKEKIHPHNPSYNPEILRVLHSEFYVDKGSRKKQSSQ